MALMSAVAKLISRVLLEVDLEAVDFGVVIFSPDLSILSNCSESCLVADCFVVACFAMLLSPKMMTFICLRLNCKPKQSVIKINRFYRYV